MLGFLLLLPLQIAQGPDLGAQVRQLFANKCLTCHNPDSDSRKAKRELEDAWDLRAVAREWGDNFAPDLAPLYEVAEDRSMPPEDSDVAALTQEEADLLQSWVMALCPLPKDNNPFVDMEMAWKYLPPLQVDAPPPVEKSQGQRLLILMGHMHASVVHFPIAFLLLAFLMRLFSRWNTRRYEFFCLLVGAPASVLAASLGWLNAAQSGAGGEELFLHRWVSLGVATLSLLLLFAHKRFHHKKIYALWLLVLALALAFTAHQGGILVYGEAYFQI